VGGRKVKELIEMPFIFSLHVMSPKDTAGKP